MRKGRDMHLTCPGPRCRVSRSVLCGRGILWLVFGLGPLTASQEAIEDEGIEWAEAHEREACRAIDELNEELGRPPKEN